MSTLPQSAGSWVTFTARICRDDQDLPVPQLEDITRALVGLFGAPLLVDEVFLMEYHQRWGGSTVRACGASSARVVGRCGRDTGHTGRHRSTSDTFEAWWDDTTCTYPRCISRAGHKGGHVLADTDFDGNPTTPEDPE